MEDLGFSVPPPARFSVRRMVIAFALVAGVLVVLFLVGYLPRRTARAALVEEAKGSAAAPLAVEVIAPKLQSDARKVSLPGSVQPLEETVLYPRANGYIRKYLVDIGDKVKEGQVLAEIETPELDQELLQAQAARSQARATVAQMKATRDLSVSSLGRYEKLGDAGVASAEELEEKRAQSLVDAATVGVAEAAVRAQDANIRRLAKLKSFAKVTAPFAGTIAVRNVDRGALVTSGNATPLFRLVATDPVRVFLEVPEDLAMAIRTGTPSKIVVREFPGREFTGKVTRTSGSLDPGTRTLRTEIQIVNPKNELITGMYADVSLTLPITAKLYELPASAIISNADGVRVAVVGTDNRLKLVRVSVVRDNGASVDVSGVGSGDKVVKIARVELTEGAAVRVADPR